VTNFTSLVFDAGSRWTVAGNDSASGLGTLGISGFAAGDTIDLTGFAAVSETFASNSLVLTAGIGNHATLAIQGGFSTADFLFGTDGAGGTGIALLTAPVIAGTVANQGVPNEAPSHPFATVTETDPGLGAIDTVTVTLSAPGNGTLSNLSTGSYDASTGVYSVTGTPAIDTAALRALVFTPIEQPNTDVVTTGFAISPGAGGLGDTTTSVTSVRQILGLAAVPPNQIAISVSPGGTNFAAPVNGQTNEAVVIDPVEGATYTVPTGYQALFLGGTADATLSDASVGDALLVANSGNDELIADAPDDTLAAGSGSDSLVGGSFDSTAIGGSGPATVFAGSGVMRVFEGSGPIVFGGNGNAGSTILGGSGPGTSPLTANLTGQNQTVSVGGSASTVTAAGSGDVVIGGSSTLNVTVTGTADTIQAGSGSSTVVSGGSGTLINGGSGPLVVMESGTGNTITGGSGATTVTASTATFVAGGSGGLTFVGGLGTATVVGGGGVDTVTPGAGGLIFNVGTSNNATVNSGSGTVSIFGAPGTTVNLVGTIGGSAGQPDYAVAGEGSETLNASGSAASDWLSVNTTVTSSATTMIAGSGNDTLIAGLAAGSTTMTGGSGSDAFVFFKQAVGGAHDVINDFTASDSVFIEGYGPGSASALQNASSVSANGLTLTLSDGTTVTFSNLTGQHALDGHVQYG
jgi:Ca2+-binding RTX toxin-like protein